MEFPNYNRIEDFKNIISDTYRPLIDNDYVLLDVPNHKNIGDNLIWKGEEDFLKTINHKCLYSANHYTFQKKKVPEGAILLLHGGGNFGDIYSEVQEFRLKLIKDFPNNKIIFFPQTVHYYNDEKFEEDVAVFKNHKNLYITARDINSKQLLKNKGLTEKVLLCPDMAFWIDLRSFFDGKINSKSLYLKRVDSELNSQYTDTHILSLLKEEIPSNEVYILDWPTFKNNKFKDIWLGRLDRLETIISRILVNIPLFERLIDPRYGLKSKKNQKRYIAMGVNFLNGYDYIYTTRLHGFILSVLLNKNVKIIDNSYGKNSGFYNTWMKDFEKIELIK